MRGLAVAAFIQEAVAERAVRVIEAEARWELTQEEVANIADCHDLAVLRAPAA